MKALCPYPGSAHERVLVKKIKKIKQPLSVNGGRYMKQVRLATPAEMDGRSRARASAAGVTATDDYRQAA